MINTEDVEKVAVVCASCGAAYAAVVWPDGEIGLIGRKDGCRCGFTEFQVVDDVD